MKGLVFTEFLEMVEDQYGLEMLDRLLLNSELKTNGVYTSVGTYDHAEMVELVSNLSQLVEIPEVDLLRVYGEHFFTVLQRSYAKFFTSMSSALQFLQSVDAYIHPEVLKLYPDAELPKFEINRKNEDCLELVYISSRRMSAFAHGLINATIRFFKERIDVQVIPENEEGSRVKFILTRIG